MILRTKLRFHHVIVMMAVLMLSACETPLHVRLIEGQPPRFTADYLEALTYLTILRVPKEYAGSGMIPGDVLTEQAIVWEITGGTKHAKEPIMYGVVPEGMKERHAAKPLEEGGYYVVMCGQNRNGGCYGTRFIIQNGEGIKPQR
jgi:hypothetical protein